MADNNEEKSFLDIPGLTYLWGELKKKFAGKTHTHDNATQTAAGMQSAEDKKKLDGIADGANKYTHPAYTKRDSGLYKVAVDETGHVSGATAVTKEDITALGIPGSVPESDVFIATYGETTMEELDAAAADGKLLFAKHGPILLPVLTWAAGQVYRFAANDNVTTAILQLGNTGWSSEQHDFTDTKPARFVVGTSANGWTAADCDYLCDGTADQTEINQAIADLPDSGGEIILLDGTYNLSAKISITKANTTLRGSGAKLVRAFAGTSTDNALIVINAENCTICDLSIDGVKGTYSASSYNYGIYIKGDNNTVEDCFIENNGHCGIIAAYGEGHIIKGNHSLNNGTYGIYLSSDHCTAIGNTCNGNTNRGITTFGEGNVITGNTCRQNGEANIHLYNSKNNIVTGNNCMVLSDDTTKPTNAIRIQDSASTGNIVTYNQVGEGAISNTYGGNIVGSPGYTYGTEDLTAGSSELATGQLYFVYE